MQSLLRALWHDESGQALVEYGMVIGLIVVGFIALATTFRTQITSLFTRINTQFSNIAVP